MIKARFIHVPKTAGTTVLSILNVQYPFSRKFVFRGDWGRDLERWNSLGDTDKESISVISGHAPLQTGIARIDAIPSFMILRHPVERAASFCRHALDPKKNHYLWQKGVRTIDALLDDPPRELRDFQTSMLLLKGGDYFSPEGETLSAFADPVQEARTALFEKIRSFGIQERFDLSMLLIARNFGWWLPPVYVSRNTSDSSSCATFTKAQLVKLESLNSIDLAVYEAAVREFDARVSFLGEIRHKLGRFEKWQALSRPVLQSAARVVRSLKG